MQKENTRKKIISPQQALLKAQSYCAYQERYQQEVRDKLYEWGLHRNEVESIIAQLILDDFLNEERFAKAFAGGKFRIKKWGRIKIKIELKKRKISDYCIRNGMKEIEEQGYTKTLKEIIQKKGKELEGNKNYIKKNKVAQYAISRGFESEFVWEIISDFFPE